MTGSLSSEINFLISDPVGYFTSSLQFLANLIGLDFYSTLALLLGAVLVLILFAYFIAKRRRRGREEPKLEPATAPKPATASMPPKSEPVQAALSKKLEIEAIAIQIEPQGNKFVVKLITSEMLRAPEKVVERIVEVPRIVEKIVEVQKVVAASVEKPRAPSIKSIDVATAKSMDEAAALIADKYHISAITIANIEGLVISSTSSTPDEDAAQATFLYERMTIGKPELGEGLRYVEIAGNEMKYLLSTPYEDTGIISFVRSKNKLESEALDTLARDLKASIKMIFT